MPIPNDTTRQVHQALDAYLDAHIKAADAAAVYVELRSIVGGNESERKAARARMPAEEYDAYLLHYAEAEHVKVVTASAAERAEKVLNTLRDVLNNETAEINRAWAEVADRTATTYSRLAMTPPARPIIQQPPIDPEPPF